MEKTRRQEETVGHLQGGRFHRGLRQHQIDRIGRTMEIDLGESEDLIEHRPGVCRCAGAAEAEGQTEAHRAGDRVVHQVPVKVPPGRVDSGHPIRRWGQGIGRQPINYRRQDRRSSGRGTACRCEEAQQYQESEQLSHGLLMERSASENLVIKL